MSSKPLDVMFDDELCALIEKYSNDGLLTAGEIVTVLEFVKHRVMHKAIDKANENEE
jgi:hypothetical protein